MVDCNKKVSNECIDCRKCIIMKYVRFGLTDFLFSPIHIPHNSINLYNNKAISAGFINLSKMKVFGYSESLGLKPKKDDEEIIKVFLRG
jgi:hypothetical protein